MNTCNEGSRVAIGPEEDARLAAARLLRDRLDGAGWRERQEIEAVLGRLPDPGPGPRECLFGSPQFTVEAVAQPSRPSGWETMAMTVLHQGGKVGEYVRGYPAFCAETFFPFERDGRWLALYSADYTTTRLMSLPDCRDLGGEEPDTFGFCPVEYYVPSWREVRHRLRNGSEHIDFIVDSLSVHAMDEVLKKVAAGKAELGPVQSCGFGFVAGCIWGDDSTWKIEFLDLSEAAAGKVRRDARFGHVHLPPGMRLRDAVDMSFWEPGRTDLALVTMSFHETTKPAPEEAG